MRKIDLPNIRRLFLPDPGYVILDADMKGADAQVVAWEANDAELKDLFRSGAKIHIHNFELMFNRKFDSTRDKRVVPPGWNYPPYDSMKRFVHATNYGASARTVAITLGWKVAEADTFQHRWFGLHPGIKGWQRKVERDIQTTRIVRNKFGYRIVYFDRPDGLLPEGLAWIPQSTIGILCSRGAVSLRETLSWCQVLIQNHDSVVFQIPLEHFNPADLAQIHSLLHIPIPYLDDPLIIPWNLKASTKSWGDCTEIGWDGRQPVAAGDNVNEKVQQLDSSLCPTYPVL